MTNGADIFPLKTQAFRLPPHASRLTPHAFRLQFIKIASNFNV
jgi:hypothetical protein